MADDDQRDDWGATLLLVGRMFIGPSAPLIAGLIGGGIAAWQGPRHASQEFYSVAAQTIPVLIKQRTKD